MRRLRSRKSLVLFCIGVLLFASVVADPSGVYTAILTPLWIVIPAVIVVTVRRQAARSDEQPVSLLSLLASRAPPAARLRVDDCLA
jgi:hypothetical protein